MQFGFPSKVQISVLSREMKSFLEPRHISLGINVCCHILLLAIGFKVKEFKIGKTEVLIRPGKTNLLDKLHADIKYSKHELESKFKNSYMDFMRHILLIRLQFLGKSNYPHYLITLYYLYNFDNWYEILVAKRVKSRADQQRNITPAIGDRTKNQTAMLEKQEIHSKNKNAESAESNAEASTEQFDMVDKSMQTCKLSPKKLKTQKEIMPSHLLRYDGSEHWITYDNPNEIRKGYRCKKEGCGLPTTVYCVKCNVHMCFVTGKKGRNCFTSFHKLS